MIERFDVIGCKISKTTTQGAVQEILSQVRSKQGGYVCFANVHAGVTAYNNPGYLSVLNHSFLTLPDGRPIYWIGRLNGVQGIEQIPGPDFLPKLMAQKSNPPLRHYFYGGQPEALEKMIVNLKKKFPDAVLAGWESPPFRELSIDEDSQAIRRIKESKADIVWVGLGAPKQEYWMAFHQDQLKPIVLLGVGAAFDFHAGSIERAPIWMRKIGLEWLHRLVQEPNRLWRRYLVTNTLFLIYALKSLIWR